MFLFCCCCWWMGTCRESVRSGYFHDRWSKVQWNKSNKARIDHYQGIMSHQGLTAHIGMNTSWQDGQIDSLIDILLISKRKSQVQLIRQDMSAPSAKCSLTGLFSHVYTRYVLWHLGHSGYFCSFAITNIIARIFAFCTSTLKWQLNVSSPRKSGRCWQLTQGNANHDF